MKKMAPELAAGLCPSAYGCGRSSQELQNGAASLQRFLFPVINRKKLVSLESCGDRCAMVSTRI